MMGEQCDRHDLVDARRQSTDHFLELNMKVAAMYRLSGLDLGWRSQGARKPAGHFVGQFTLGEVDARTEHPVKPGEGELIHDVDRRKVGQDEVEHSTPCGDLQNHTASIKWIACLCIGKCNVT